MLRTITNAPSNQTDLSLIFRDMRKDRWKRVAKQLKSSRGASLCALKDPSGLSILSVAVMSNPPLEILLLILQLNPAASLEQDDYGSIPLHLACLNGANSDVIRILLEHDNGISAAVPDDMDRRVPLHHAVEFAARLDKKQLTNEGTDTFGFSDERDIVGVGGTGGSPPQQRCDHPEQRMSSSAFSSSSSVGEDSLIISLLCDAVPEMVHFRSRSGETPMDIAHVVKELAETPKELERIEKCYSILQNTSIMLYKKKKKEWEDQGFDKVLNPDGKGGSFSNETSTAESTNSSSRAASNLSALASLDPSMTASIQNTVHPSIHSSGPTMPMQQQSRHRHHHHNPLAAAEMISNLFNPHSDLSHELKMHMMGFNVQHLALRNDSSYDPPHGYHHHHHLESFQYPKETQECMFSGEVQPGMSHPLPLPPPSSSSSGVHHHHHHYHNYHHYHIEMPPHPYPMHLDSNEQQQQQQQEQQQ
jgi:ankyrin repeat protein